MSTKQDAAISFANQLGSLAGQAQELRSALAEAVKRYNSEAYNTIWNAMATAPQNTDGTLGAADSTPQAGHPIDNRVYPTLSKALTANALVAMITFANDFNNFLTNVNPGASQRSQTIDDLAG
jgi:hypothetical protein